MKNDPHLRIGIVGAGAAGLAAAEALRAKGYANVTILEKEAFAGGKCRSIEYDGRTYEIGAGIIAENCTAIKKLARKYAVEVARVKYGETLFIDAHTGLPQKERTTLVERISLLAQILLRYRKLVRRFYRNKNPGLSRMDAEFCLPFSEWTVRNGVTLIEKQLAPFFVGFGYGYFDEVPTAYVLKHYSWETIRSFIAEKLYTFPNGIQHLWTAVAKDHDVRYGTTIRSIVRGDAVTVRTDTGEHAFDRIILTSPLDESLGYMDATAEEKNLFSKIEYVDYRTCAVLLKDFPKLDGYVPGNFISTRKGHPLFWHHQHEDSDFYAFYVMGDFKMSDEEVLQRIRHLVQKMGGSVVSPHSVTHWKYFPHVSCEEMQNGYFDKLEALQGEHHTYFAGELLNFSTVEHTADYARKLVETHF